MGKQQQPSDPCVISASTEDYADFRVQIGHDETRTLGSATAFPEKFWAQGIKQKNNGIFTREGLRLLYLSAESRLVSQSASQSVSQSVSQ